MRFLLSLSFLFFLAAVLSVSPIASLHQHGALSAQLLNYGASANGPVNGAPRSGTGSASSPLLWKRVFFMYFENHGYLQALFSPEWQPIIQKSLWLTNFHATTHPSQPNYIATMAGDTIGCAGDGYFSTAATSLVDLLEAAGVSWKSYQENYTPGPNGACADEGVQDELYYRKHNPFMSFESVRNHLDRCQKIVNASQLDTDIANNDLPQFSFYTPNILNDAHNTDMPYAGRYLQPWLEKYLNEPNFINETLFLVTFDEDEWLEFQHIPALLFGPTYVNGGQSASLKLNHFSLTRAIEENWGLGNLGRHDVNAVSLMDLWRGKTVETNEAGQEIAGNAGFLLHNLNAVHDMEEEKRQKVIEGTGNQFIPFTSNYQRAIYQSRRKSFVAPLELEAIRAQERPLSFQEHFETDWDAAFRDETNMGDMKYAYRFYRETLNDLLTTKDQVAHQVYYSLAQLESVLFPSFQPQLTEEEINHFSGLELLAIASPEEGFTICIQKLSLIGEEGARAAKAKLLNIEPIIFPKADTAVKPILNLARFQDAL